MKNFLFVEKYRPEKISDCILPKKLKNAFQSIVDNGKDAFPNMILAGAQGTGKTTAAVAMCKELGLPYMMINASEENGIDVLRTKIKQYATTNSLDGGIKVVILDEADYLNASSTQPALRGFIESYHSNCRFILTCNYKNKIIPALHSRCPVVDFIIPNDEKEQLGMEMFQRMDMILSEEKIAYDQGLLVKTILRYFPDFRMTIGKIQQYSKSGTLSADVLSSENESNLSELFKILKSQKFQSLRKWVAANSSGDIQSFYSDMYDYIWKNFDNNTPLISQKSVAVAIPLMQQYAYESAFVADNELNMMAFLTMFMVEVEYV